MSALFAQSIRTYTRDELTALWRRAKERAAIERTRAWRSGRSTWTVLTQLDAADRDATRYTVLETGARPFDTFCPCLAGQHGVPCKHRATVAFARAAELRHIIMVPEPSAAAAHCLSCGRWFAVHTDTELRCPSCC